MRAIILAAGLGTRMRPATNDRPKALLPFLNEPLLLRRVRQLSRLGIREIAINLHHEGRQIVESLSEEMPEDLAIRYFWEPEILGTAGALRNARDFFGEDDFIVWNVDAEVDFILGELMERHRSEEALVTLVLAENPDPGRFTPVQTRNGRVTGFGGAGKNPLLFTGISVHSPRVLARIPAGFATLVDDLWRPLLEDDRPRLSAITTSGRFFDLGSPRDFLEASLAWLDDGGPFEPRAGDYDAANRTLSLGPIDGNATRSVLGRAAVGAGARIDDCVVWNAARVGANARLRRCLVGAAEIPEGFVAADAVIWPAGDRGPKRIPI